SARHPDGVPTPTRTSVRMRGVGTGPRGPWTDGTMPVAAPRVWLPPDSAAGVFGGTSLEYPRGDVGWAKAGVAERGRPCPRGYLFDTEVVARPLRGLSPPYESQPC